MQVEVGLERDALAQFVNGSRLTAGKETKSNKMTKLQCAFVLQIGNLKEDVESANI